MHGNRSEAREMSLNIAWPSWDSYRITAKGGCEGSQKRLPPKSDLDALLQVEVMAVLIEEAAAREQHEFRPGTTACPTRGVCGVKDGDAVSIRALDSQDPDS